MTVRDFTPSSSHFIAAVSTKCPGSHTFAIKSVSISPQTHLVFFSEIIGAKQLRIVENEAKRSSGVTKETINEQGDLVGAESGPRQLKGAGCKGHRPPKGDDTRLDSENERGKTTRNCLKNIYLTFTKP